jgi:hypothetical protein
LIQTAKLFASVANVGGAQVDPSGKYYVFTPTFKLLDENEQEVDPQILVGTQMFHDVPGDGSSTLPDLCLVGTNIQVKKGYYMRIMRGDVVCWGGPYCIPNPIYLNLFIIVKIVFFFDLKDCMSSWL